MKLKPYPKYKPSGVKWIGDIPDHWEVKRLKYICSESAVYGANIKSEEYIIDGMRFLRTTDITDEGGLIVTIQAGPFTPM
jgi:type I restriction enzyme S subunit